MLVGGKPSIGKDDASCAEAADKGYGYDPANRLIALETMTMSDEAWRKAHEPDDSDYDELGASREEYEAFLGKFLVSFNRIENIVSELLARALVKGGREDLVDRAMNRLLDRRLDDLELLMIAYPKAPTLPYAEIRELAKKRNDLAHGHYDDWQGYKSFEVITRGGKRKSYPPHEIIPLLEVSETLAFKLRQLQAHWDFEPIGATIAAVGEF